MIIIDFDKTKKYYVYVWKNLDTNELFYVGKGTKYRCNQRKRPDNPKFMEIVNSHKCVSEILADGLDEETAFYMEEEAISIFREHGFPLINEQDGGYKPPIHYGKRPQSWVENMRDGFKLFLENNPDYRKELSERMKKFLSTENGKEFMRKSLEARRTPTFRKAQRERSKRTYTEEKRKEHSILMTEVNNRPEMREARSGAKNVNAQLINQYSVDGNFIRQYETITQAAKETGATASKISAVAHGKRKTAGGFVWQYATDKKVVFNRKPHYDIDKDKCAKPILQYDLSGNLIAEYKSIAEAVRITGFANRSNIIVNLKGRTKSAYGYVWKYK